MKDIEDFMNNREKRIAFAWMAIEHRANRRKKPPKTKWWGYEFWEYELWLLPIIFLLCILLVGVLFAFYPEQGYHQNNDRPRKTNHPVLREAPGNK